MSASKKLNLWVPGESDKASKRNEAVNRLNELTPLTGSGLAQVASTLRGTSVHVPSHLANREARLGVITDTGPEDQEDYTDERYFVMWVGIVGYEEDQGDPDDQWGTIDDEGLFIDEPDADEEGDLERPFPETVTNLGELELRTHSLPTDETRFVWCWNEPDTDGNPRWMMNEPVRGIVFPVYVEKTGGSDGSNSTAASYTYTVRSLSGAELDTGVAVAKPRDNGTVTFQTGTNGLGLAFYVPDSGSAQATLKLWDAGEKYSTASCA